MGDFIPSLRILVCGEAGVGKSTICSSLCDDTQQQSLLYNPTIGCKTHVAYNDSYFTELFDIGGSPRFASSRSVFYDDADAVIYVYVYFLYLCTWCYNIVEWCYVYACRWDTNMEVSYHAIDTWLSDIHVRTPPSLTLLFSSLLFPSLTLTSPFSLSHTSNVNAIYTAPILTYSQATVHSNYSPSPELARYYHRLCPLPLCIIGNKVDKLSMHDFDLLRLSNPKHVFLSAKHITSSDQLILCDFFNKVLEYLEI